MIVVAEGDEVLRQQLVRIVEQAGFQTYATGRRSECLHWINVDHVALVLLDVLLADGNGLEALKEIRERHPDVPVVVFTGAPSSVARMLALQMGACAYIAGHLDPCRVRTLIQEYVKREPSATAGLGEQGSAPSCEARFETPRGRRSDTCRAGWRANGQGGWREHNIG